MCRASSHAPCTLARRRAIDRALRCARDRALHARVPPQPRATAAACHRGRAPPQPRGVWSTLLTRPARTSALSAWHAQDVQGFLASASRKGDSVDDFLASAGGGSAPKESAEERRRKVREAPREELPRETVPPNQAPAPLSLLTDPPHSRPSLSVD